MTERGRLGVQDALWLEMDRPTNLMVVDSLVWTSTPVDWDRMRVVEGVGGVTRMRHHLIELGTATRRQTEWRGGRAGSISRGHTDSRRRSRPPV